MILVCIYCFDPECRVFLYCGVEYFFEFSEDIWFQYLSPILSAPYDVILMLICRVIEVANSHGIRVSHFENTVVLP